MPVPTYDLPVAWWVFWMVVMGALAFGGLSWWLLRAALREDRVRALEERERRAEE